MEDFLCLTMTKPDELPKKKKGEQQDAARSSSSSTRDSSNCARRSHASQKKENRMEAYLVDTDSKSEDGSRNGRPGGTELIEFESPIALALQPSTGKHQPYMSPKLLAGGKPVDTYEYQQLGQLSVNDVTHSGPEAFKQLILLTYSLPLLLWQPKGRAATHCNCCKYKFRRIRIVRRQHTCRACGQIVCTHCSKNRVCFCTSSSINWYTGTTYLPRRNQNHNPRCTSARRFGSWTSKAMPGFAMPV